MADGEPVASFFSELKLKVDEASFNLGTEKLKAFKAELSDVARSAREAGDAFAYMMNQIPKKMPKFDFGGGSGSGGSGGSVSGSDNGNEVGKYTGWKTFAGPLESEKFDPRIRKDILKDQNSRLKEQKGIIEDSLSGLKKILGVALSIKAAYSATKFAVDTSSKGLQTQTSAYLMGLKPTEYMAMARAFEVTGANADGLLNSIDQLHLSWAKLQADAGGNPDFLKFVSMMGIDDPAKFTAMGAKEQSEAIFRAMEKGLSSKDENTRNLTRVIGEQLLGPEASRFVVGARNLGGVDKALKWGASAGMTNNSDIASLAKMSVEFKKMSAEFSDIGMKFMSAIGKGGLTDVLSGFNNWYLKNKDWISKVVTELGNAIGGFIKFVSDFLGGTIGMFITAGQRRDSDEKQAMNDWMRKKTGKDSDKIPQSQFNQLQGEWNEKYSKKYRDSWDFSELWKMIAPTAPQLEKFKASTPFIPGSGVQSQSSSSNVNLNLTVRDGSGRVIAKDSFLINNQANIDYSTQAFSSSGV